MTTRSEPHDFADLGRQVGHVVADLHAAGRHALADRTTDRFHEAVASALRAARLTHSAPSFCCLERDQYSECGHAAQPAQSAPSETSK